MDKKNLMVGKYNIMNKKRITFLIQRFYEYLKKNNNWVSEKILISKASERNFSSSEIQDALRALQEHTGNKYLDIGDRWTKELGKEYRWYKITSEEIKLKEEALAFFDEM